VTYVDMVAMRRAAMTSRSSSGDSGVMEPVSRQCYCKHCDYATIQRRKSVVHVSRKLAERIGTRNIEEE
jgi:hypothetical protein